MENELVVAQNSTIFVERIENKVATFCQSGKLTLPPDYSVGNALRSAYLLLQEVKDRNKQPALKVCTDASVYNALLEMAVMGLNPAKKQCYFIVFGKQLTMMRSYFGAEALAKRVRPEIRDIVAQAIYLQDEFDYTIEKGQMKVVLHKQKITNKVKSELVGAYALALDEEGNEIATDIMTMEEIKASWRMSKTKPVSDSGDIKEGSTHDKFLADMAKKTVIARLCKPIINSSSDQSILGEFIQQNQIELAKGQLEEQVEVNANALEFEPEEIMPDVELPSPEEIAAETEVDGDPFGEEGLDEN
jgi:recombination protein RecT